MLHKIISFSIGNKLLVAVFVLFIVGWGAYSVKEISIDAVPDITNNQVQIITTSQSLSTQDIEQFITYPVELAMANLPGLVEIRSVSKFGLSVVTVVFEESMGTYLPRQLIAEKIIEAKENIPSGFGTPELGPITTGLGEIYQYTLDVLPGYESQYSITELRSIQDWVVKRQLSGIPGVVEVNTWGGKLKQYEVSVSPAKLRSQNITIGEIFQALKENNSITGAGYIEKNKQSYFIRGEGLITQISDIEKILVKNVNGHPVFVKDIADVNFGFAPRFGAITGNGEGEKVMGQVMLLKDAKTNKVLPLVKERMAKIQKSLPKGVVINNFLDRGELLNKTTNTVIENLLLGALIVIFIVILLLGDWRAGLLIASVIPLCLLFALSLMNLFGISANLMSLGAVDFGIIIDGAIIVVEFILLKINKNKAELLRLSGDDLRHKKDQIALEGANRMMRSAIFGQIIILIVFMPILALRGVEGKMFIPMALTFSFAILGALILGLTYIPAMASLVLTPTSHKNTVSNKLNNWFISRYEQLFDFVVNKKRWVFTTVLGFMIATGVLFSQMGGEFVPTLDEGDLVIQPVFPVGTSLEETIKLSTKIESVLMQFDEVDQVVSRIGAAEVPTDPMNMEQVDIIVKLQPIELWRTKHSKEDLIAQIKSELAIFPGVAYEFSQPIEMRFNELITGVRSDIAIKLYGDDLEVLAQKGEEIQSAISAVAGAAEITLEKTKGLPQMLVKYNREKVAQYGLNLKELNEIVQMNFSGVSSGKVFEGERRFDLVVRLAQNQRKEMAQLENLFVKLPNGHQVRLNELAEIDYTFGPAKISRDNTKRRIVVGVNVLNRDLESVVNDIKQVIDTQVEIPTGYMVTYGGQFENLENATSSLLLAVPISLLLIFLFLYLAFNSVRDSVLIFSAIPLAATGGIWLLWLRDMPFSISAGVGFIALFGIAVLNGIVLIEHFKTLKKKARLAGDSLVKLGTMDRIRPVLLTATTDALGFFPMAVSHSAGAEVQRPLATVVIGGLITSTILTLVVLPLLYSWVENNRSRKIAVTKKTVILSVLFVLFISTVSTAQQGVKMSIEQVVSTALANHPQMKVAALEIEKQGQLKKSAFDLGKTKVQYNYGQINSQMQDYNLGIQQSFDFPTAMAAKRKWYDEQQDLAGLYAHKTKSELTLELKTLYNLLQFYVNRHQLFSQLDSSLIKSKRAAERAHEEGEMKLLEYMTIAASSERVSLEKEKIALDLNRVQQQLKNLMVVDYEILPDGDFFAKQIPVGFDSVDQNNISLAIAQQEIDVAMQNKKVVNNEFAPELSMGYFNQQIDGTTGFQGVTVGVSIPVFFWTQKGNSQAAKISYEMSLNSYESQKIKISSQILLCKNTIEKYAKSLGYFESRGLKLSNKLISSSERSYAEGEIGYIEFINVLKEAYTIQSDYLESLKNYNKSVIELNYLLGAFN